jgi:hypothetical protein
MAEKAERGDEAGERQIEEGRGTAKRFKKDR